METFLISHMDTLLILGAIGYLMYLVVKPEKKAVVEQSQAMAVWKELCDERERLENEMDAEIENLEAFGPQLLPGMQPDDPYAFQVADEIGYRKASRKIDRLREQIDIIKKKMEVVGRKAADG